jgi:hypothetical protein
MPALVCSSCNNSIAEGVKFGRQKGKVLCNFCMTKLDVRDPTEGHPPEPYAGTRSVAYALFFLAGLSALGILIALAEAPPFAIPSLVSAVLFFCLGWFFLLARRALRLLDVIASKD